jgi:hypothetical protein
LYAYDSVTEARQSIIQYVDWYNRIQPRSSLGKQTPDEVYAVVLQTVNWQRENQQRLHLKKLRCCSNEGGTSKQSAVA